MPARRTIDRPAALRLKEIIKDSGRMLKGIATEAGVDYDTLSRWYRGSTNKIDLDVASKVHETLVGEPLL